MVLSLAHGLVSLLAAMMLLVAAPAYAHEGTARKRRRPRVQPREARRQTPTAWRGSPINNLNNKDRSNEYSSHD